MGEGLLVLADDDSVLGLDGDDVGLAPTLFTLGEGSFPDGDEDLGLLHYLKF